MRPSACTHSIYLTFLLSPLHFPPSRSLTIHPLPSPPLPSLIICPPPCSRSVIFLVYLSLSPPALCRPSILSPLWLDHLPCRHPRPCPSPFLPTPPPPVLPLRTICDDALAEFTLVRTLPNYRSFLTVTLTIPVPLLCFSLHLTLRENQVIMLCSFQKKK